ncbi:GntR family transcriptional regulator [Rhodococcus sp. As11]|uniref:GntR family transcriptional regulator n=1 Tax=Rhodococcus sp. As11 TaxID=3029189 RepID=UPI003B78CCF3
MPGEKSAGVAWNRADGTSAPRRGDAVERTYYALRERILSGMYRPGVSLSQVHLAEELSVSRTPLREALRRLEAENLVVNKANRGVVVTPIRLRDVEDSYAMRLLVEPALVSAVLHDVTDTDTDAMAAALAEMDDCRISPREFQLAHWRYHCVILDRCPIGMRELIESNLTLIDRHQRMYFERPAAVGDITSTDTLFLAAIRNRDGHRARSLLEFHLLDTAIGMIMALDTGHEFDSLTVTLKGLGIAIDDFDQLRAGQPTRVDWQRDTGVPAMTTANLITTTGRLTAVS